MVVKRIKHSFGKCHHQKGKRLEVLATRYVLDQSREFYLFDIVPMGAIRMTNRDRIFTNPDHKDPKKRQRPVVTEYFYFKKNMIAQANLMGFVLPKVFEAVYFIPMPDGWSEKKKAKYNGMPHESTPDEDNITKAIKDSLRKNDSDIWWVKVQKRWAYKGSILIFV